MTITFVNKSAFASGTGALTVGAVTGVAANDLILLFVESENQAVTTPTGYTIVTSSPVSTGTAAAAGAVRLSVFYRLAAGADTTTTVADSGDHTTAIKIAYRGVDTTTPFDATPVSGIKTPASTTATFPAITTATNNALVVLSSALDLDAASTATTGTPTNANLTGLTERHDQTVIAGDGGGLVIIDGTKATAGSTGTTTATVTSTIQVYLTIALKEAPVTGSLSVTETGTDTFAGIGEVLIEGALASTEDGTDTFSASGSVIAAAISGSLDVTETGSDTFSASGLVIPLGITGSLAVTETGADAFSASGNVIVEGSLAVLEVGADTFASTGTILIQGSFNSTEAVNDSFNASGVVTTNTVSGALSVSETGDDSFASAGQVIVSGSLSANESGSDTFASGGQVIVNGSLSITETSDQLGSYAVDGYVEAGYTLTGWEGRVLVDGALSISEVGADAFSASGGSAISATATLTGISLQTAFGSVSATGIVPEESTGGSFTKTVINATAKVKSVRAIAYAGRPTPRGFTVINGGAIANSIESQLGISEISASGILGIDDESLLMLLVA